MGRQSPALLLVGGLFFVSLLIRAGIGAAPAMAREEAATDDMIVQQSDVMCETDAPEALVDALQQRERRVGERETAVGNRLHALQVAERDLQARIEQLIAAEESLAATLATATTANDADITTLVAVYENMKPGDASVLFEEMDPDFAAGFLSRMRPDTAAAIFAGLEPSTAYSISVVIAGRNARAPTQ